MDRKTLMAVGRVVILVAYPFILKLFGSITT